MDFDEIPGMTSYQRQLYKLGMEARQQGVDKDAGAMTVNRVDNRSFWLAGWHDQDMIEGNEAVDIELIEKGFIDSHNCGKLSVSYAEVNKDENEYRL